MKTNGHLVCAGLLLSSMFITHPALADGDAQPKIVGTWSLALDAGPFGIPGFALTGLATFHRDGTVIFADAGDFGSLGTLDTNQFGVWVRTENGVSARLLSLSASPDTGEPMRWGRANFLLTRGENHDHMVGIANVDVLNCEPVPPLPGAITCPDPVVRGDEFVPIPPFDIPLEFHRLSEPDDD